MVLVLVLTVALYGTRRMASRRVGELRLFSEGDRARAAGGGGGREPIFRPLVDSRLEKHRRHIDRLVTLLMSNTTTPGVSVLLVGAADTADVYTALCWRVQGSTMQGDPLASRGTSVARCPQFDEHIHDERIVHPVTGRILVQFIYWARGPLALAMSESRGQRHEAEGSTATPSAVVVLGRPSHIVVGRGLLDALLFNTHPPGVVQEVLSVVQQITTLLATPEPTAPPPRFFLLLPRHVPERPIHVGCLSRERQRIVRTALQRLGGEANANAKAACVVIDPWPMTATWRPSRFDWRGLGFVDTADYLRLTDFVAGELLRPTRPVAFNGTAETAEKVEETDSVPLLAAARRWNDAGIVSTMGRNGNDRRCNCTAYFPSWCDKDERWRRKATSSWRRTDVTRSSRRIHQLLVEGGPGSQPSSDDRHDGRAVFRNHTNHVHRAWTMSPACVKGGSTTTGAGAQEPVNDSYGSCPARDRGSPCGAVPVAPDAEHEWIIWEIGNRWPMKPHVLEVNCRDYVRRSPDDDDDEHNEEDEAGRRRPNRPEKENRQSDGDEVPQRCLVFFGRRDGRLPSPGEDNLPDVDLEECFASRRISPLIIGSSHQMFGLPVYHPFWQDDKVGDARANRSYQGYSWDVVPPGIVTLRFAGQPVVEFRWDAVADVDRAPHIAAVKAALAAGRHTHVVFGTAEWGLTLYDWTPKEVAAAAARFVNFFASTRASPQRRAVATAATPPPPLHVVLQLGVYNHGRPMQGRPDVCTEEYRVDMYREALLCGAHEAFRNATRATDRGLLLVAPTKRDLNRSHEQRANSNATDHRQQEEKGHDAPEVPTIQFSVINLKPMTQRAFVERSVGWDGTHYVDYTPMHFIFYATHAPICRQHVLESTEVVPATAVPVAEIVREDDHGAAVPMATDHPPSRMCGPLNCRPQPLRVEKLPSPLPDLDGLGEQLSHDPRYLGFPATRMCGCKRYACTAEDDRVINYFKTLSQRRRQRLNLTLRFGG